MLLSTERLTKDYGRFRALDRMDLSIQKGEVFGLLGPNGSGKTTAIRMFLGFLRPSAGRATIAGHDCWRESVAARQHVAYLPGELRLYENMTGRQLVRFLTRLRGQNEKAKTDQVARRLDIDLDRPIAQLSSGMKRKVALLQVLVPQVDLLIMDEPTNTLDPNMRDLLLAQLREARRGGQAVLFSSHVLSEAEQVCDRVGILKNGQLVHLQEMSELRDAHRIRIRFASAQFETPPALPGLTATPSGHQEMTIEHRGALQPILAWLARQNVADVRVEPLGLSAIYHHHHGAAV
jgi:ABC-2 type transport system ATP-binding protein